MWVVRWCIMVVTAINHSGLPASCLRPPFPGEVIQGGANYHPPIENATVPCPRVDAVKNRIELDVKMFYVEHEVSEKDARTKITKIEADNGNTSHIICLHITKRFHVPFDTLFDDLNLVLVIINILAMIYVCTHGWSVDDWLKLRFSITDICIVFRLCLFVMAC